MRFFLSPSLCFLCCLHRSQVHSWRMDDRGARKEGSVSVRSFVRSFVRFLRSERENDFSETGGRGRPDRTEHGRNRRFLIRPPPVAENAVSYRQKRRTDGPTDGRGRDGESWERNPGSEKCYLFAGDNNAAATATPFFPSPSAT